MKLTWLIILSLVANVLMGGLWLKKRSTAHESPNVEAINETILTETTSQMKKTSRAPALLTTEASARASAVSWKDVQTADLKELVRRLRAIGCPEETVRDIILAEVNRRYAARNRELWPEQFKEQQFWKVQKRDSEENRKNRERSRKSRELQKEKSALLVELLGVDPEKEQRKEDGLEEQWNWMDQRVAFLPEEKRDAALKYLEDFEDRMQDFYERTRGMWDAESRAEQRQLEVERLAGLAQFLTPQELREYELRQSQLASQLSHDLRGLSLARNEYEAIFDIRKKYGESIYNYGDIETKEARDQVEVNKKAMQAEIVAALGKARGKDYERSQDYPYQELARLSKKYDLPPTTASTVYDFKETAEQSAKQLRDDKTLTDVQRQEALQRIRAETENAVKKALGETIYKRYLRQGGWWINSIAPAAPAGARLQNAIHISN